MYHPLAASLAKGRLHLVVLDILEVTGGLKTWCYTSDVVQGTSPVCLCIALQLRLLAGPFILDSGCLFS